MMRLTPPRSFVLFASLVVTLSGIAATAHAELMRYEYHGVVTQVNSSFNSKVETTQGPSATFFTGSIAVGDRFTGTFAYDPTEAPNQRLLGVGERSDHYGKSFDGGKPNEDQLTVAVGGQTYLNQTDGLEIGSHPGTSASGAAPTTNVKISNDHVWDLFNTRAQLDFVGASPAHYPPFGPPPQLKLSDFQSAELSAGDWSGIEFQGSIDSLKLLSNTPEPSTGLILGSVALGYLGWSRRRLNSFVG